MISMNNEEKFKIFQMYSLPYFSQIENINLPLYQQTIQLNKRLIWKNKAMNKYCPEWWVYIHSCETITIFLSSLHFNKIIVYQKDFF